MLRRNKSSERPQQQKPNPRPYVLSIANFARIDDAMLLEAVLSGAREDDVVAQGKRSTPRQVVDDAFVICQKAWDFVRRLDPNRKSVLRGCSRDLLILAARQAVLLDDLLKRQETDAKEQADAHQKGRQQLQAAFEKAGKLRDQARRLFAKIVGPDETARAEALGAALAEEQGGSVAEALDALAQFGQKLLADADPTRRQCIAIYGLDEDYLQLLEDAREELMHCESEFESLGEAGKAGDQIHWCAGVNLLLMSQIIEAFISANELDSTVPFLRPVHHEHLVRRISKLPPPPLPRALAVKSATAAQAPAPAPAAAPTPPRAPAPAAAPATGAIPAAAPAATPPPAAAPARAPAPTPARTGPQTGTIVRQYVPQASPTRIHYREDAAPRREAPVAPPPREAPSRSEYKGRFGSR